MLSTLAGSTTIVYIVGNFNALLTSYGILYSSIFKVSPILVLYLVLGSMGDVPKVLILGHSFIKRLKADIARGLHPRMSLTFSLYGTADILLHGVGGRKIDSLRSCDLHVVEKVMPDIVLLEIGTNDLMTAAPEVVGSALDDLVTLLRTQYSVKVVGVCLVIPRVTSSQRFSYFWKKAKIYNNYVKVVLDSCPGVFCWRHKAFTRPGIRFYDRHGVHLNTKGQYLLYRSYRGAILHALHML